MALASKLRFAALVAVATVACREPNAAYHRPDDADSGVPTVFEDGGRAGVGGAGGGAGTSIAGSGGSAGRASGGAGGSAGGTAGLGGGAGAAVAGAAGAAAGGAGGSGGAGGVAGAGGLGGTGGGAGTSGLSGTLADGLVAHWDMEEGTGTTIRDRAANPASDGTLMNGAKFVAGGRPRSKVANAWSLAFDGNGAFVELVWRESLQIDGPKSIALWYRDDAVAPCRCIESFLSLIDPLANNGSGDGLQLGLHNDNGRLVLWRWGGLFIVEAPVPTPGTWHQVTHTYDGTTHTLYVDGVAVGSGKFTVPRADVKSARLGTHYKNAEYLNGLLDDVRIWNRALTPAEIQSIAGGQ